MLAEAYESPSFSEAELCINHGEKFPENFAQMDFREKSDFLLSLPPHEIYFHLSSKQINKLKNELPGFIPTLTYRSNRPNEMKIWMKSFGRYLEKDFKARTFWS